MEMMEILKRSRFFSSLNEGEIKRILPLFNERRYSAQEVIYREGESGDTLNLIVEGRVNVARVTAEGEYFSLSSIKDGEVFGIMSFFDGSPHSATIIAQEDVRLLVLRRDDFERLLGSEPVIYAKIVKNLAMYLASILRDMNSQYMDLMHMMFRKSK